MQPLTSADREFAQALNGTGLPYRAALVLIALGREATLTQRKLEVVTKLRKPELKHALQELKDRRYLKIIARKRDDGTPFSVYSAREPFENTLAGIIRFEEERVARITKNLERLKGAVDR